MTKYLNAILMVLITVSIQNGHVEGASMVDAGICWIVTLAYIGWLSEK